MSRKWMIVFNTIGQAASNLITFGMLTLVMFLGFTIAAYTLFGAKVEDFSSLPNAFITSLMMVMRLGMYEEMKEGDSLLATPFFIVFHLYFLILTTVLLSIMVRGY